MSASTLYTPVMQRKFAWIQWSTKTFLVGVRVLVSVSQAQTKVVHRVLFPSRRSAAIWPKLLKGNSHHTPPVNAIKTLNARVLFSTLSSACRALKIPTITTRMSISPAEQTVKEMLEILFLWRDSKLACSSALVEDHPVSRRRCNR